MNKYVCKIYIRNTYETITAFKNEKKKIKSFKVHHAGTRHTPPVEYNTNYRL